MENTDCIKKIYLVGGAVRDHLLGLPIKDRDYVAVGFKEEDFKHLRKVGKSFPVFLQKNGTQIALARKEKKIAQGYNGFCVQTQKVSLYDDLKRRDLTINAIAFDEENGVYYDPFLGQKDLKNKILRHISSAFCEDPLRVLRIARFRARLGEAWRIHPSTKALILTMQDELKALEKNRVFKEVEAVFLEKDSYLFFETLFELGVLKIIFPHIYTLTLKNNAKLQTSLFLHTMEILKRINKEFLQLPKQNQHKNNRLILQFCALYHAISYDKNIESLLDIAIPNSIKKNVLLLLKNLNAMEHLHAMRPCKILELLASFKGNLELFYLQIIFSLALKNTPKNTSNLESFAPFIRAFIALKALHITDWIQAEKRSTKEIKAYVLKERIRIIKASLKTPSNPL